MDFVPVYNGDRLSPVDWARRREEEGWHGVAMADHIVTGRRGHWHPFAALGAMAVSTSRVTLTTAYGNNLMRSPVEFAQAALSLHALSSGRYEVGLGAGWAKEELVASGLDYPPPRQRAERFREAVIVVRDLLRGACKHDGRHYKVDLLAAGPAGRPAARSSPPRSEERGRSGTSRRCSTGSRSIRREPPSARAASMRRCSPPRRPTTSGA